MSTPHVTLLGDKQNNPLFGLATDYLRLALAGDRRSAVKLVLDAVEHGAEVRQVYLHVFQPVQREIGRLWQLNQISVAQEHFCTAVTQLVMSQLYPHVFASNRRGASLVATCIGGELHEIGVRMVADFFELDGWDTLYLGASTPHDAVLDELGRSEASLLAISVTMQRNLPEATELVRMVRDAPGLGELPIIIGGFPFLDQPDLWRELGADGTAPDAEQAVALGHRLLAEGASP